MPGLLTNPSTLQLARPARGPSPPRAGSGLPWWQYGEVPLRSATKKWNQTSMAGARAGWGPWHERRGGGGTLRRSWAVRLVIAAGCEWGS